MSHQSSDLKKLGQDMAKKALESASIHKNTSVNEGSYKSKMDEATENIPNKDEAEGERKREEKGEGDIVVDSGSKNPSETLENLLKFDIASAVVGGGSIDMDPDFDQSYNYDGYNYNDDGDNQSNVPYANTEIWWNPDVPLEPTGNYHNWTDMGSLYGVERGDTKIIQAGVKFLKDEPTVNDTRTSNVVVARVVDLERDTKVGVALSRYNLNYVFATEDPRDQKFKALFGYPDPSKLPKAFELQDWGEVFDQFDLGACVGWGVYYALRWVLKKRGIKLEPSVLFDYFLGRKLAGYPTNEDTGMTVRDGYKAVAHYGICTASTWPYDVNKFSTEPPETAFTEAKKYPTFRYLSLDSDINYLKKCLVDGYPITFGAALFASFMTSQTARSGNIPVPNVKTESRAGGHCMTIVGYDDAKKAFKVCNQWGTSWGQKGFCWFPYDYMLNKSLCSDFWSPRFLG